MKNLFVNDWKVSLGFLEIHSISESSSYFPSKFPSSSVSDYPEIIQPISLSGQIIVNKSNINDHYPSILSKN